jgi:hypothetical protein
VGGGGRSEKVWQGRRWGSVAFGGECKQLLVCKLLVSISRKWDVLVWRREFARDWRAAFGRLLSLFNPTNHASYCIKEFHLRCPKFRDEWWGLSTRVSLKSCDNHVSKTFIESETSGSFDKAESDMLGNSLSPIFYLLEGPNPSIHRFTQLASQIGC